MKKLSIIVCTGISILLFVQAACNQNNAQQGQMNNENTSPVFKSAAEAAQQAKSDLLKILRTDKNVNLGIEDTGALADASPGNPVRQFSIDFDRLLSADSNVTLASLVKSEKNTIIPLVNKNRLITIVELDHRGEQWKITALAGKALSDDLRTVSAIIGRDSSVQNKGIILYDVPNLNAKLFSIIKDNKEIVFTGYNSLSIREGINASALIPMLKKSAIRFQQEFGDQIKKQKMVE
ncbi:MAG: hypothetical protein EPN37_10990 [Chitinophagaceae bacterium]|jgi:hypothetical protein|nr:MAG: hypothetical protein EPN37_10990 [Chitinophagaceae bacterium]